MPISTDPGWKLETDEHGCSIWKHPNDVFQGGKSDPSVAVCGARRVDAGGG